MRALLLKRQQFQQQQQQKQQDEIDMKKSITLIYENNIEQPTSVESSHELVHPNAFIEKEVHLPSAPCDLSIWDGLWSMDDFHGYNSINLAIYQHTMASYFY